MNSRKWHEERINALIAGANKAIEDGRKDEVSGFIAQLSSAVEEAGNDRKSEVYGELEMFKNPMLEAARVLNYDYPSYKVVQDRKTMEVQKVEPADASKRINPAEFGDRIINAGNYNSCPYEKTGLLGEKAGHVWEYRSEKLAYLLVYHTIKEMADDSSEDLKKLKADYRIRELAMQEEMGEVPDSKNKVVKLLQSIIDKMVFVPRDDGENAIRANSHDAAFLFNVFCSKGRNAGELKVLKGNRMKDYIFEVVHMIVTAKGYLVSYGVKKDAAAPVQGVRGNGEPIPVSDNIEA